MRIKPELVRPENVELEVRASAWGRAIERKKENLEAVLAVLLIPIFGGACIGILYAFFILSQWILW